MANTDARVERYDMTGPENVTEVVMMFTSARVNAEGGGSEYEPPTTGQLYPTGTEQD